tara:strand:+ start:391 stop:711 length:321 start_codon:yes stop_codon:yes gene_type:complete
MNKAKAIKKLKENVSLLLDTFPLLSLRSYKNSNNVKVASVFGFEVTNVSELQGEQKTIVTDIVKYAKLAGQKGTTFMPAGKRYDFGSLYIGPPVNDETIDESLDFV